MSDEPDDEEDKLLAEWKAMEEDNEQPLSRVLNQDAIDELLGFDVEDDGPEQRGVVTFFKHNGDCGGDLHFWCDAETASWHCSQCGKLQEIAQPCPK